MAWDDDAGEGVGAAWEAMYGGYGINDTIHEGLSDAWEETWGPEIWDAATGKAQWNPETYTGAIPAAGAFAGPLMDMASRYTVDPYINSMAGEAATNRGTDQAYQMAQAKETTTFTNDPYMRQLQGLSNQLGSAPSVAQAQGNAAFDRAAAESAARAASARGANTGLMLREAAASSDANRRQLSSDLGAAAAQENIDRINARAGLSQVGAGINQQASQYRNQSWADLNQQNLAGAQGRSGMYADAGALDVQGQRTRQDAVGAAGNLGMQGQEITARSHDTQKTTSADVAKADAKNEQETVGGLFQGAAAVLSDVRAKESIRDLEKTEGSTTKKATEGFDTSLLEQAAGALSSSGGDDGVSGNMSSGIQSLFGGMFGGGGGGGGGMMSSDERGKENAELLDVATAAGNRENLAPLKGYGYQYKPEVAAKFGEDTGRRVGVMAQDLEKAPAGDDVVFDTEDGKALDLNRAVGFSLAGLAGLDKRLREVEGTSRGGREARTPKAKKQKPPASDEEWPMLHQPLGMRAYRRLDAQPSNAHAPAPPKRIGPTFDELDEIRGQYVAPPADARRGFGRAAVAGLFDAAAAPVKLGGMALEAAGVPNAAADLEGREAVEALEWLRAKKDPLEVRRENESDAAKHPYAVQAGEHLGGTVGGGAGGALSARLSPGLGAVLHAARKKDVKTTIDRAGAENLAYERDLNPEKLAVTRRAYKGATPEQAERIATEQITPIRIDVYPDTTALGDGRHRLAAAKEAGAKQIAAKVVRYDKSGKAISEWTGPVSIAGEKR